MLTPLSSPAFWQSLRGNKMYNLPRLKSTRIFRFTSSSQFSPTFWTSVGSENFPLEFDNEIFPRFPTRKTTRRYHARDHGDLAIIKRNAGWEWERGRFPGRLRGSFQLRGCRVTTEGRPGSHTPHIWRFTTCRALPQRPHIIAGKFKKKPRK